MNSSSVSAVVAPSSALIAGRIGSTRPMPMKAITHANATAHTDFGWRRMLAGASTALVVVLAVTRPHLVPPLVAALVLALAGPLCPDLRSADQND